MTRTSFSHSITPDPTERHYSVQQIAEIWKLSENTVRHIFEDMPGVLKIQSVPVLNIKRERKRGPRVILRIPHSCLERAYQERSGRGR